MRSGRGLVWWVVASMVVLATGCSNIRVTTDFDPSVSFDAFSTFAFLPSPGGQQQNVRTHNSLVDGRVEAAVTRELEARGLRSVPPSEADLWVVHHVGIEQGIDVRTVHTTHRYRRGGWSTSMGGQTTVQQYERGTLLIDVLKPPDRTLIWRGSGNARLRQSSTPEQRTRRIDDAVSRILKSFPPSS